MAIEADPPQIRIVTESTDSAFLARLAWEAQQRGLALVLRQGSEESVMVIPTGEPVPEIESVSKPPGATAFRVRVEIPVGYPPEAGKILQQRASDLEREIREALGYHVSRRYRPSTLTSRAKDLKADTAQLPRNAIYDIADRTMGEFAGDDPKKRNVLKSRKHRVRKRLVEPYKPDA